MALPARAAVQLVLPALALVAVRAQLQVPVQQQARWALPAQVPLVVEQAEVLAVAERGLLALAVQPAQAVLVFPRQQVLEQELVAPELLLSAKTPNPVYRQWVLPKMPERELLFLLPFLLLRGVLLLLLVKQIAVERVHAAPAPQRVLAAVAGSEPAI